ncbi:hypothetical protein [Bradyrhizobium sp. SZCCHNS3053]|uniref:hypothetical protein n=1 Tax=Bradyrhizobium sp. SZCCHNS3053 TaxID=3057322 RepID=UPI002916620F|nr:hypothetical protein [Bradyrhizobium sp. SZCCHNS3053]
MTAKPASKTITHFHPGDEAYEKGWYLVELDEAGFGVDAIGAFDSEAEAAKHIPEKQAA